MAIAINEGLANRLQTEQVIWLTTVRADGTPVPTPVWFYWHEEGMLIFTQPGSHKLHNIAGNPKVALNFNTDAYGGSVAVFTGEAYVDPQPVGQAELNAYLEKYREGIKMIGLTEEQMAREYSTVLRVRVSRVRVME
jgi:PPOX class probable F420-dependent enzyme